ncbi:N-acetyltransferase family protein [Nonomuraea wenchangensis]|uniref:Phosphinothricin acetyltransferase n=1 Tax=Nonomuraea wenchangensis TaxID=568860 RepID=A0A1I0HT75_9ACTN|nr:GNAT family N-acetyltransferase [Nonomuraea wenchangensis]SET87410.1 phosphinothricin acetyltransferase [Nonomuraea wenchangensis]
MTHSDAVIRPAVPADLAAVTAINAHYVANTVITFEETPPTVADWQARLADLTARGFPFLVADVGGEVAGYAYAGPWRPKPAYRHTVEDSIYLAPGHSGRGLGGALLGALIDGATAAGLRRMIAVIADAGDDRSIALHRRHGFTEAGRLTEVGFKLGRWVDTTLMERPLT